MRINPLPARRPPTFLAPQLRCLALCAALALPVACQALSCTVSALPVSFGVYNPWASMPRDTTTSMSVSCSALLRVLVSFTVSADTGSSASYAMRQMQAGGTRTLQYQLYTDAARTQVWGNGSAATDVLSTSFLLDLLFLPVKTDFTIYARMPARQTTAAPGAYTDQLQLTVVF